MDAISGISLGGSSGVPYVRPNGEGAAPAMAANGMGQIAASQSLMSINSLAVAATSETFVSMSTSGAGNKDLMNALLLLLTLEYLRSDNEEERKGLLALIATLAQASQSGESQMMLYSSSAMSIESTQIQIVSSQVGLGPYGELVGGGVPGDAGSGGIDITV